MKNLNRRICGLLLTVAMVLSLCCPALAAGPAFPDTEGHWAEEIIQTLAEDGIINGCGDGKCHPDAPITRGQFATLVARALKLTPKVESAQLYTDIAGHWASGYITALSEANIILPTDYGTAYEPDKEITRMEMVVMVVRAIGKESEAPQSQGQTKFTDDGEITAADSGYINVAAEYEIIVGYPDGRVCPYQGASRAEGFCMLTRMLAAHKKLQESTEGKDEDKKPEPSPGGSTGGGHSGGWSVPAPQISFTLPETAYIGTEVAVTASTRYASSVEWTLVKDGASETPEGFDADGGVLTFSEAGSYTLKATVANSRGKTTEYEQTIAVYPVVGVAFTLPATAHTDTAIPVDLLLENAGESNAVWSVKRDGQPVELVETASGTLDNTGGILQFTQPGEYELTVSVEDALGKVSTCTQTVAVYPVVSISIDLPDIAHMDEEITLSMTTENLGSLSICWTGTLNGEEINPGDYLCGGYADMGQLSITAPGTYTLTATLTDETGRVYTASDTMTCYPVGSVGFFLPTVFHTDDTVLLEATITELADNELEWTLNRNGEVAPLDEVMEGVLTENGGQIRIKEQGSYTLTASYTDGGGRSYSYEQNFTVYPVPAVEYSLPATAWTDTLIPVEVQTLGAEAVTIEWLVDNTYGYQDWDTFVDGSLTNDGGTIRFKRAGTYELVARITDATGRVFLYESGVKCEVQPVLAIRFELPEQLVVNEVADIRTSGNNNILPVEWSLTKDGQSVSLSEAINGGLNAYGGKLSFKEDGAYALTASMTDVLGRTVSQSRTVTVAPPPTYRISVPESCHIGTAVSVSAEGENLDGCTVQWTLTDSEASIPYVGTLELDGGAVTVERTGSFLLTATVTDRHGNTATAQDEIRITNSAPEAPKTFVWVEYGDSQNPYTTDCKVKARITVRDGNDPDGDSITYEYATDSARDGYYGLGSHTVKVRSVDEWGETSEWHTHTFTVESEAPEVSLTSQTLGENASTTNAQVDFTASVVSDDPYRLSAVDYYAPGSEYAVASNSKGGTIQGQFSSGRHLMVVQAKNLFGKTGYASRFFVIGSSVGSETANITSLATTVEEKGIYDGSTPLAYIERFTFDIPAISGHNTSCQDVVTVYGITEDGTKETVLTFKTNNGYVHIDSDGSYKYTASGDTVSTAAWTGWNGSKYTKLIFSYVMTSGHESCLNNATKGLSYTVGYSFIEGSTDNLENLFE